MRILITGDKSYVGTCFEKWLNQWPGRYHVNTITLKTDDWEKYDFSCYDTILHVAAIVHQKERPEMEPIYFKVNRDLPVAVAKKAKYSGVKQFIFMSSMSVYGIEGEIGKDVVITKDTPCKPNTFYGKSKLEAENELTKLNDKNFNIAIIRSPVIYGPNCPGNYSRLRDFIIKSGVFPLLNNQRSMIFIDNLCEFIRLLIENKESGFFFPQNREYIDTVQLVRIIAKYNFKNVYLSKILSYGVKCFGNHIRAFNKVFGNLKYDMNLSSFRNFEYCVADFENSIEICEKATR